MEETPRTDKIVADWLGGKISAVEMRRQFQGMERDLIRAQVKFVERVNDDKKYLVDPICCLEMGLEDCQTELVEARAEIERRKADYTEMNEERLQWLGVIMKQKKLIEQMVGALNHCKSTFEDYVKIHKAKMPVVTIGHIPPKWGDMQRKIARNQEAFDLCNAALSAAERGA